MNDMDRRAGREEGFTLIEFIIAIVLSSLLFVAVTTVLVTSMNTLRPSIGQRAHQTNEQQVIASFLTRDAQAAGGINPDTGLNSDTTLGVFTNASASCPVSGTVVVRFRWTDTLGANPTDVVYELSGNQLIRDMCVNGSATPPITMARSIQNATAVCTPPGGANPQCPNRLPDRLDLTITALNDPQVAASTNTYTLSANVRPQPISFADSVNNFATAPFIMLGTACPGITINNGARIDISGTAVFNQSSGCDVLQYGTGNGQGVFFNPEDTQLFNNSTCSHCTGTVTTFPTQFTNPFPNLVAPNPADYTPQSGTSCNGTINPGVYQNQVTVGTNCVLTSGVYIFQGGLDMSHPNVKLTNTAGGVLIYLPSGAGGFSPGNGSVVDISGITSGPYAGLAVWEVSATQSSLGNGASLKINGTFYAPAANVDFANVSETPVITALIVKSVTMGNGSTASIGPVPLSLELNLNTGSAILSRQNIYYRGAATGSFTLTNDVNTPKLASTAFPGLAGSAAGFSYTGVTVTTPAGGPHVSNLFSWNMGTTSGPTETVTATSNPLPGQQFPTKLSFVNDSTAPSPTIGANTPPPHGNSGTPTIAGTAGAQIEDASHSADNSTVTVKIFTPDTSGTLVQTITAPVVNGAWSVVPSPALAPNAQYTAQVTQADELGNTGSATTTFTVDTTAPTAAAIASAPSPKDGTPNKGTGQNTGDKIVYTFSEPMLPSSISAGWDGTSTGVTVHFAHCAGTSSPDCMTVTNVNLGKVATNGSYVLAGDHSYDAGATMVMTGNVITVTITGNTSPSGNVIADTGTHLLVWTPSASAQDLAGNNMSTAPVTQTAAAENF